MTSRQLIELTGSAFQHGTSKSNIPVWGTGSIHLRMEFDQVSGMLHQEPKHLLATQPDMKSNNFLMNYSNSLAKSMKNIYLFASDTPHCFTLQWQFTIFRWPNTESHQFDVCCIRRLETNQSTSFVFILLNA